MNHCWVRWAEVEENTIAAADRKRAKMASRPLFSGSKDRRGHALTPWFSKPPPHDWESLTRTLARKNTAITAQKQTSAEGGRMCRWPGLGFGDINCAYAAGIDVRVV